MSAEAHRLGQPRPYLIGRRGPLILEDANWPARFVDSPLRCSG
jgi:hypothetical protein